MTKDTTKTAAVAADIILFDNWFDPIEDGVRKRVRGFIGKLEEELESALSRPRYARRKASSDEDAAAPNNMRLSNVPQISRQCGRLAAF